MLGDLPDFVRRLRSMLPRGWFGDVAPVNDIVLAAMGAAPQSIFTLISAVRSATRISTASGYFLDLIAADFFGATFYRQAGESDQSFRVRLLQELLRSRGTRSAITSALQELTGRVPVIIEPARPADTGAYRVGGVGFGVAGAWGNLLLTHACFVTAYRPMGLGIAALAGYGTGGVLAYGDLSMVTSPASDADIAATTAAVLPLGYKAWLRISS